MGFSQTEECMLEKVKSCYIKILSINAITGKRLWSPNDLHWTVKQYVVYLQQNILLSFPKSLQNLN